MLHRLQRMHCNVTHDRREPANDRTHPRNTLCGRKYHVQRRLAISLPRGREAELN